MKGQEVDASADITYVTSRWGAPTQTFVRREADALVELGVDVDVLSIKRPLPDTKAARHLPPLQVVAGFAVAFAQQPLLSLRLLADVRHCNVRNVAPMLVSTIIGLAWSGRGLVDRHLHSHFGWVSAAAARAAAVHGRTTYSVVYHAFEIHTEGLVDDFACLVASEAEVAFTISQKDLELFEARFGTTAELLRMGVGASWLREPRTGTESKTIVSVGSLTAKKGHRDLIEAVSRSEDWQLVIVGEGEQRAELEALIEEKHLAERVSLVGLRTEKEVAALMIEADIFALACVETSSGNRDGIPVALIEAMAMGLPVVTTDAGAIEELVAGAGVVVPQRNPASLADAFEMLQDPEERLRFGRLGHATVQEGWTADHGAHRVRELLPL